MLGVHKGDCTLRQQHTCFGLTTYVAYLQSWFPLRLLSTPYWHRLKRRPDKRCMSTKSELQACVAV